MVRRPPIREAVEQLALAVEAQHPDGGPGGVDVELAEQREHARDRLAYAEQVLRNETGDAIVTAYHGIFETFGERLGDVATERSDQMNPVRAQARAQDRNRYDPATGKSEFFRHQANDVAVAQHLRAADVKNATRGFRCRQHSDQIRKDVLDGDGRRPRKTGS